MGTVEACAATPRHAPTVQARSGWSGNHTLVGCGAVVRLSLTAGATGIVLLLNPDNPRLNPKVVVLADDVISARQRFVRSGVSP
jgi:hypothetical protein